MKFLVCGIGSIGQRHYKNILSLGHEAAVFRSTREQRPFVKKFIDEQAAAGNTVQMYYDLSEALATYKPDAVFVTNPNHLHMEPAIAAVTAGCHVFIEKPVSHTLDNLDTLQRVAEKKNLKVMVGYNLRFHPLLQTMKKMFDDGDIGAALQCRVEVGENIEDWHPWENYLETYAPHRKSGGGVVLCFSHDIDYLYWFLGKPQRIQSWAGHVSSLGGDAEDMCEAIWDFGNNKVASVHLDYFQRPPVRTFKIIGEKGTLTWNYHEQTLSIDMQDKNRRVLKTPETFERNTMFVDEVTSFIKAIEQDTATVIPLEQGIDVLKISLTMNGQL